MNVNSEALALFVRFVRANPGLAEDDEVMERVLEAYHHTVEEVPEVEVSASSRSSMHVESSVMPPEGRRSGAKNVAAPEYQDAFISEARASMGQPSVEAAERLLGQRVTLVFNDDRAPVTGILTQVVNHLAAYLVLDDNKGQTYPLNGVQEIRLA
jgi:hypothetical protein